MSPNEQKYKPSYAPELLRLAEADDHASGVLMAGEGVRPETTLFSIQQSIEKALKAVICFRELSIPLTHDLYALVQKLEPNLPPGGYDLHDLTPYATVRRYEEGEAEITDADLKAAQNSARNVIDWAKTEVHGAP